MTDCRLRTVIKRLKGVILFTLLSGLNVIDPTWAGQSINNIPAEVSAVANRNTAIVRSRSVNVNYHIASQSRGDIDRIELWYGRGEDGPWMFYGYDQDRATPVRFIAPSEGVYRFLVVAIDRWGRSSCGSGKKTTPDDPGFIPLGVPAQQTVFIDYTEPELYLRNPQTNSQKNKVEIRWMGFDPYLRSHPVKLYWQLRDENNRDLSDQQWKPIGTDQLATGQFTWHVPVGIQGHVVIKAVLTDQAGNHDIKYSSEVLVDSGLAANNKLSTNKVQPKPVAITVPPVKTAVKAMSQPEPVSVATTVVAQPELAKITAVPDPPPRVAPTRPLVKASANPKLMPQAEAAPIPVGTEKDQQVERYYRRGTLHSCRNEWVQAKQAYLRVLELEPHYISARVNLADVFFKLGDFSQAKRQYERCLEIKPNHKQALFGLAQVQIAMTQFGSARQTRDKLLSLEGSQWQSMLEKPDKTNNLGGKGLSSTSRRKKHL